MNSLSESVMSQCIQVLNLVLFRHFLILTIIYQRDHLGREGGREGGRERGKEGGRERGKEGGRERGREGGRERGREGGREGGQAKVGAD